MSRRCSFDGGTCPDPVVQTITAGPADQLPIVRHYCRFHADQRRACPCPNRAGARMVGIPRRNWIAVRCEDCGAAYERGEALPGFDEQGRPLPRHVAAREAEGQGGS